MNEGKDTKEIQITTSGIGFFQLLTVLFIALKLTGNIDWSWLWVLSPLWIPIFIVIMCALIGVLLAITATIVDEFFEKFRK